MKKLKFSLLLIIMMLCLADNTYAQKQKIDIKMVVLDAKQNGNNISDLYLKRKQFLTIYNNEDNELLFANVSGVNDDQSFGDMFGTETKDQAETDTTFRAKDISFSWKYINNYDKKQGTATVNINLIFKPQGTVFYCHMMLENLDVYEYTGYVEGTLDSSKFGN
jgi:hypothetical protein